MKRIILNIAALFLLSGFVMAQKYAFVDTDYILNRIPSYKAAQDQLDKLSTEWQTEVENLYTEIEKMYKDYQTEKVLLNEEMRVKKEEEIVTKEQTAKNLQKEYFGRDGSLFKKREELVKPIQDEVYRIVKEIATEGNYAVIFDTASGANMIYTDPKYDKSDEVLEKLGYKN
jgi:outer membrane protein